MTVSEIRCTCLGQSGFRFDLGGVVVYVDPYLSNRVAELEGDLFQRQIPIARMPEHVADAHWILVSHVHLDHCDLATLVPLARSSPAARFIGPEPVIRHLLSQGFDPGRLVRAQERWMRLGEGVRLRAVPAAHPEPVRDSQGCLECVGYVIESAGRRLYHAGDTSVHASLIDALRAVGGIDTAFLPVNERNFFRERRGIVGNMTVREAFLLAEEIGVRTLVPMHWDMFAPNSVYPDEIELLYQHLRPGFALRMNPESV